MFETYRMLGREHLADLEREAQLEALARTVRKRAQLRLVLRSLGSSLAAVTPRTPTLPFLLERRKT